MIVDTAKQYNKTVQSDNYKDNSKLEKNDFLNMFLTELKHQDPMDPMDSSKMLDQTMKMTTIEQSENQMKKTDEMVNMLNKNYLQSYTQLIGKNVMTERTDMVINEFGGSFAYQTKEPIKNGNAYILDAENNIIKSISLNNVPAGLNSIDWNGNNSEGLKMESGAYNIRISGVSNNGEAINVNPGEFTIESLKINGGNALINIGNGTFIDIKNIKEFL